MKKSKLILSLGAVSSIAAVLPMISAGCVDSKRPKNWVAGVKENEDYKLTDAQKAKAPVVAMITDGGDIHDLSFNQSAWEACIKYGDQNGFGYDKYNVYEVKNNDYNAAYNAALNGKATVWVLPGFNHLERIIPYLKENKEKLNDVTLVTIDFNLAVNDKGYTPNKGQSIAIEFETKEGGFLAGYAAGKYLSQEKEEANRTFSTFGGGAFPGVTDFNEGFYKGILQWNEENPDAKVKAKETKVILNSWFNPTAESMTSAVTSITTGGAKMVMAVAGPATHLVASNKDFTENGQLIVGVDTDQSLTSPKNSDRYFTSILKRIGQATYDVLGAITSGTHVDILGGYVKGVKNGSLKKGISQNWVDISDTHISGDNNARATEAIKLAKDKWATLSQDTKEWLLSNKVTKNGAEEADIQTRMNQLSAETKK